MLVGEAPGREEDDAGRPFVGGAGRVLNALLSDAGIARTDCYVTNICRCRPPNNRAPELDEILACQDYLTEEIKRVNPRIIVALGDTASSILGGRSTNIYRGAVVDGAGPAFGRPVLITYHPTFVMRMRSMFPVVAWDLRKAKTYEKTTVQEEYNYTPTRAEIISTFQHIRENDLPVAVDIETAADKEEGGKDDALDPYAGEIIGIAFAWGRGKAIQLDASTMIHNWDVIGEFLSTYPRQVYANNKFDRLFVWVSKGTRPLLEGDVQTAMHMIYPALPKKLDFLRSVYTDIPPYKNVYKTAAGGKYRPEKLSPTDLARLNCLDVDVTLQVFEEQKKYVPATVLKERWKEEEMALEMQHRGVYIDVNAVAAHYASILPDLSKYEHKFDEVWGVSISSPKQLSGLLYDRLGLPYHDDKGKSCCESKKSTNEKAIKAIGGAVGLVYIDDDEGERFEGESKHKEVLLDILTYRGAAKLSSTYCEGVFKSIKPDGRVHSSWNVNRTATHRWSCTGVPLQGVPKHLRNIVRAPEGKIFMGADYKGMQVLGAGVLAGQWDLVEDMQRPDFSIHNVVLEAIRPHWPQVKKTHAKAVVFGKFFGRSDRDIAMQFHVPLKTVNLWTEVFYTRYPKLRELFEEKHVKQWEELGYVLGVDGDKLFAEKATEAKNYPVQNFETRVVKTAMWNLREAGFSLILMGHDQLVVEEPDDERKYERFEQFLHIMQTARPDLYPNFPVEGGMGYDWQEVS